MAEFISLVLQIHRLILPICGLGFASVSENLGLGYKPLPSIQIIYLTNHLDYILLVRI